MSLTSENTDPVSLCGSKLPSPMVFPGGNINVTHHFLPHFYPVSTFHLAYTRGRLLMMQPDDFLMGNVPEYMCGLISSHPILCLPYLSHRLFTHRSFHTFPVFLTLALLSLSFLILSPSFSPSASPFPSSLPRLGRLSRDRLRVPGGSLPASVLALQRPGGVSGRGRGPGHGRAGLRRGGGNPGAHPPWHHAGPRPRRPASPRERVRPGGGRRE